MAKSSITPGAGSKSEAPSDSQLPVPTGSSAVTPANDAAKYDDGSRDVIIPRLGLIGNIGPLWKKFQRNAGDFAFEERLVLGNSVQVIPLSLRKFYVEIKRNGKDLKFGDGIMPKIFQSANEANLQGYGIDFDSLLPNKAQEAGEILYLVQGPADDVAGAFYIEVDGKFYAPALMTYRRGGFRSVWKLVNTAKVRAEARKAELYGSVFTLTSKLEENAERQQAWYEPRITPTGRVSEAGIAAIREAAGTYLGKAASSTPTAE